jgi:uncharacterized membrane protein
MSRFQHTIEVNVPVHAAFEMLTHWASYPDFMSGVKQVTQLSETDTRWVWELGGVRREFDAHVTDCQPDKRLAWQSLDAPLLSESMTLKPVSAVRTHITAELEADAKALLPGDRNAPQSLSRQLKTDLSRFKEYVEHHADSIGD